ncbi:type IX secretion system membrane protein PorP/SprF [Segetibacter sp.]|uniref:type IX secretion system membrane protein PorP/SprF n=1 Tax=Segetibacter sp. TaxID=2231182 RepID=UPI00260DB7BF|nr:type IX secretion system membrane protein PorP/SprF [Segetibacter sp.]
MRKKLLISTIFCLVIISSFAQDLKLSQYKMAPSFYNPATTGKIKGTFRSGSILSNQKTDSATLNHALAFADYKVEQENGSTGFGISYYQNFQREFCLTSNYLSASIAKHIFLDVDNHHMLSFGGQLTLATGTVNAARTTFSEKISGGGFEMSGLPISKTAGYKDLNLGLMYTYEDESITIEGGLAAYHVLSPVNNLNSKPTKIARRVCFTINSKILLDDQNEIELSSMMWKEGLSFTQNSPTLVENTYSASLERFVGETSAVYLGLSTRSLNSVTPSAGFSLYNNSIRVMASYEQPFNKFVYNVRRAELSMMLML